MTAKKTSHQITWFAFLGILMTALTSIGCQSTYNGSGMNDMNSDIQYFAPGPHTKLARTAVAITAQNVTPDS